MSPRPLLLVAAVALIDRDGRKQFEQGVIQAARLFDDRFAFDFNGPWPPHNFVEIDLRF